LLDKDVQLKAMEIEKQLNQLEAEFARLSVVDTQEGNVANIFGSWLAIFQRFFKKHTNSKLFAGNSNRSPKHFIRGSDGELLLKTASYVRDYYTLDF